MNDRPRPPLAAVPSSPGRKPAPIRFLLRPLGDVRMTEGPRSRVKGLVPREGLVVVWGAPKSGKSFLVFDMAMHVALGWSYRGRPVEQGAVVYCALEGAAGWEARIEAFRQHRLAEEPEPVPFYLMTRPLRLAADVEDFVREVREQMGETVPAVVVVDTLNRAFVGSENDDKDMNRFIEAADAIRRAFDCAVVVVHHSGVAGDRPRGHTALGGAVDAQLSVRKTADGIITMAVEWMKDGSEGDAIVSRLRPVEVGQDTNGDAITSCIVEPLDGIASAAPKAPTSKPTDRQVLALRALAETALQHGEPAPPSWGLPPSIVTVSLDDWRTELRARGVIEHDDKNPTVTHKRIKTQLAARLLIGERDGRVWATH